MSFTPVRKISLPDQSALHQRIKPGDFIDCYAVKASMSVRRAAEVITDFPPWARLLLMLRRVVTAPFGLDNDGPEAADRVGIFPVEQETEAELIAGFNDKHLNFRVAVLAHDAKICLATWAAPHLSLIHI